MTGGESKPEGPAVDGSEPAVLEANEKWSRWLHGVIDDSTGDHQTASQCHHRQTANQLETQQNVCNEPRHERRPATINHAGVTENIRDVFAPGRGSQISTNVVL